MTFKKHCTGNYQTSPTTYVVGYIKRLGEWVTITREFMTEESALAHSRKLAKTKTENGR